MVWTRARKQENRRAGKGAKLARRRTALISCSPVLLFFCFFALPTQASLPDRLLGLDAISLFDPNTGLGFEHVLPAWVWALVVLAAVAFAGWSYSHLVGPRLVRGLLALLRGGLVLLIVVLLCKPQIVPPG